MSCCTWSTTPWGDPLIGGWITPAVPLITTFLLNFEGTDRMYALVGIELILGLMYVILGLTGIATKIIDICPQSLKGGILIGSGFAACCGTYGFTSVADGGRGFFATPSPGPSVWPWVCSCSSPMALAR